MKKLSDARRKSVAYHEAGHSVASIMLGRPVKSINIDSPEDGVLGQVRQFHRATESRAVNSGEANAILRIAYPTMVIIAAGPVSEKKFCKRYNWIGASSDNKALQDIALKVSCGDLSEAKALIKWVYKRTERLLSIPLWWRSIGFIANALLRSPKLSGKQHQEILKSSWEKFEAIQLGRKGRNANLIRRAR